jgi:hypothetical protein
MREGLSRRFVPNHFGGRFRKTVSRYFAKPNYEVMAARGLFPSLLQCLFFRSFYPRA